MSGFDDDGAGGAMWELFEQESEDYLGQIEHILSGSAADLENGETMSALFRAMHSLKGVSASLGLTGIELVAHHAEDLLDMFRNGEARPDEATRELLLQTADTLVALREQSIASSSDAPADMQLVAQLTAAKAQLKSGGAIAAPAPQAAPVSQAAPQQAAPAAPAPPPQAAPAPPPPPAAASPAGRTLGKAFIMDNGISGLIVDLTGGREGSITWSDGRNKISIFSEGRIEFTDDDRAIKSMSGDGYLYIMEKRGSKWQEVEIEPGRDYELEYTYSFKGREREFDEDAREWLADVLIDAIRKTGLGAEERVERIFERDGIDGVLDEIEKIESDYVNRLYFRELLLTSAGLGHEDISKVLKMAARVLDSDYETAELLLLVLRVK